ncbi:Hsp20 family protein [Endozoicomonas sp. SM1973]|uniref:Hsp20 family protein n=1 Tax=Spartinivicinus marinus TaxID=2994442 RepID=A0A853I693_9GAMM|nr:Hsp20 family protein [Spartinivicinus marinus]NYZ66188.1 Hsp20 family protein [Spartinivicinus marinus]
MPGVKKEDIHLTLENGTLTLEAETKQEGKEEREGKVIRQERRYGKLMRSFSVGNNVHESDISAKLEDEVLTLKAPKLEETSPSIRRIDIK